MTDSLVFLHPNDGTGALNRQGKLIAQRDLPKGAIRIGNHYAEGATYPAYVAPVES